MKHYNLSYVVTNFNRLQYLKPVMENLIKNIKDDEEIIVTDGLSTDGSAEYLNGLFQKGLIHKYISEKDLGEAHGFNKGILMASGELIKIITSDDIFYYPAIEKCKKYMLANPSIDILITDLGFTHIENFRKIGYRDPNFNVSKSVLDNKKQITFGCGLTLMIRKSQIPKIGLFNPNFIMVDYEFSYRNASIANFAYYNCPTAVHLQNTQSNLRKINPSVKEMEYRRVDFMYGVNVLKPIYEYSFSQLARAILAQSYRSVKNIFRKPQKGSSLPLNEPENSDVLNVEDAFIYAIDWLQKENLRMEEKFLNL